MKSRNMVVRPTSSGATLVTGTSRTVAYSDETFGLRGLTGSATDMAIGEDQFFVTVTPENAAQTEFRYANIGPARSSLNSGWRARPPPPGSSPHTQRTPFCVKFCACG